MMDSARVQRCKASWLTHSPIAKHDFRLPECQLCCISFLPDKRLPHVTNELGGVVGELLFTMR